MKRFLAFIFLLIGVCAGAQIDKIIPSRPVPPRLVNDYTGTLLPEQIQALEQKLVAYDDSTSSQVAIMIIGSLQGYDIAEYGLALGRKWGIGGKEFSNGVIILVAKDDHKLRIETGYGMEGAIPDITAKSIVDNDLTPNFKEGNYYRGLDKATDDIFKAAAGEYTAPAGYNKKTKGIGVGAIAFIMIMIFFFIAGRGGGRGGGMASRRGFGDIGAGWIIGSLLSGGRGGSGGGWSGGGGGGGGGGFGGFGGGGFGGGGSSGSW